MNKIGGKETNKVGRGGIILFLVLELMVTKKNLFGITQANNVIVLDLDTVGSYDPRNVAITNSTCVISGCVDSRDRSSPVKWMDAFVCFPPAPGQIFTFSIIPGRVVNINCHPEWFQRNDSNVLC